MDYAYLKRKRLPWDGDPAIGIVLPVDLGLEDVKSKATQTAQYQIKSRMMMDRFWIEVKED